MIEFSRKMIFLILGGGIAVGLLMGLIIGWIVWPVEYFNTDLADLKSTYRDDYVVMVAADYFMTGDIARVNERLQLLGVPDPGHLVTVQAERYISAGKDISDIQALVALARGLGVDTPSMERYLATPTITPAEERVPALPTMTPAVPANRPDVGTSGD